MFLLFNKERCDDFKITLITAVGLIDSLKVSFKGHCFLEEPPQYDSLPFYLALFAAASENSVMLVHTASLTRMRLQKRI